MTSPGLLSTQGVSRTIALVTVLTLVPLFAWDASPQAFPARAHGALAAIPLALIATACLVHAIARRAHRLEVAKACLLVAAFLFWAINQGWPEHPLSTLFNDLAVALFVIDVFLAIFGWPVAGPPDPLASTLPAAEPLDPHAATIVDTSTRRNPAPSTERPSTACPCALPSGSGPAAAGHDAIAPLPARQ
jgi:hypothetical protein